MPITECDLRIHFGKTPKSFWTYQSSTETPTLETAIKIGAISPTTTPDQWGAISPGMRREIVRSTEKGKRK